MVEDNPGERPVEAIGSRHPLQIAWAVVLAELHAVRGAPVIVVPLILCGLLMFQEQGADLTVTAGSDLGKATWLVLTAAFYGFHCWFWARLVVEDARDRSEPVQWTDPPWVGQMARDLQDWTPRLLGAAPLLIASVATLKAGIGLTLPVILFVLGGLAPLLFRARLPIAYLLGLHDEDRFYRAVPRITLVLAVGSLVVLCVWPVEPARFVGAIGVVFLGLSFITAALAGAVNLGRRLKLPVLAALLLMIVLVGGWFNFNHVIGRRTLHRGDPPGSMALRGEKPTLQTRLEAWCEAQPEGCANTQKPTPIVFVAAQGGASRAGYWAADVLGRLQFDSQGGAPFSDRVFAISSVSGGSVGVMAYVSTLADTPRLDGGAFADSVAEVAGADYLSPVVSGLLFPDLVYRVLPLPFLLPDRAETLETGFESGWRRHCRGVPEANGTCDPELWAKPFLSVWRPSGKAPRRWLPVVLINGARQEDGRRIITADVKVTPEVFPNAVDFHDLANRDVRVSTAIHNGARFPIVSPGGVLIAARRDDAGRLIAGEGQAQGHLIDGGYFDGGGVVTMAETAAAVLRIARVKGYHLKPVFIELNNDNDKDETAASLIRAGDTGACEAQSEAKPDTNPGSDPGLQLKRWLFGAAKPAATKSCREGPYALHATKTQRFLVDLLAPVEGLASVSGAHGEAAGMALAQATKDSADPKAGAHEWGEEPAYLLVHLCDTKGVKLPMDWALSTSAMRRTDRLLGIQAAVRPKGKAATVEAEEDDVAQATCRISQRMKDILAAVGAVVGPDVQVRRVPGQAGDAGLWITIGASLALATLGAGANVWANGKLGLLGSPTTISLQRLRTADGFRDMARAWGPPKPGSEVWRLLRIAFGFDLFLIVGYAGAGTAAATLLTHHYPGQAAVFATAATLILAAAVADLVEDTLELRMIYVNIRGVVIAPGKRLSEDELARLAFLSSRAKWTFLACGVGALALGGVMSL